MLHEESHIIPPRQGDALTYLRTCNALDRLKNSICCQKCFNFCEELFSLGQCEHRLCRLCANKCHGKSCPVCSMPSRFNQVNIDKQLSHMAALCMQMSNLLDGKCLIAEKTDCDATLEQLPAQQDNTTEKNTSQQKGNSNQKTKVPKKAMIKPTPEAQSRVKHKNGKKKELYSVKEKNEPATKFASKQKMRTDVNKTELQTYSPSLCCDRAEKSAAESRGETSVLENNLESSFESKELLNTSASSNKRKRKSYLAKRNAKGETPLQVATIKFDVERVTKLLEDGANPNVRDYAGWTPLHEAVNHGKAELAELLIKYGASVNAPGLNNDTPLHDAVSNHHIDCVKLLVDKGANTQARNLHGRTPLDIAVTDEIRKILFENTTSIIPLSINAEVKEVEQSLYFMGTALSKDQQLLLKRCATFLHAKIVENFSPEVTHLVTGVNAEGMCPRTLKYLHGVLAGKWIVSTDWLVSCIENCNLISEDKFEVKGCCSMKNSLGPQKGRLNRLQQLPGLFDGCQFYFHGKFNSPTPSREELVSLVRLGGGVLLTREPRLYNLDDYPYTIPYHASGSSSLADCAIFVVYDDHCPNPPYTEAQRMSYLPASWLLDSAAAFTLLDKFLYLKR
ncbi:unnamed protein product [Lymnaea stagnalis]|uniref:BRCA1-associated RING domain protein 1 n=1 Tax=Lymnaea stagnalis TaxID=6523 RepID=A0AAV2GWZ1_LYMST